jgi:membrane-bound metal-dependent hydrolase YbcI (DUF457 family)
MDIVSHALWGGIALGRRGRRAFALAAGISLLPDVLTEGLFGGFFLLHLGGMPGWEHGHPDISVYPLWAQHLYNVTHSLVVFAFAFLLVWALVRRPVWVVAAWGLHVLIDIPTHSLKLFPTPFLWPLSSFKINGANWGQPAILGTDELLLLVAYSVWFFLRRRSNAVAAEADR